MKSIDKLKRLTGETIAPTEGAASAPPTLSQRQAQLNDLRERIENTLRRRQARNEAALSEAYIRGNRGLIELVSGREVENEAGRFFLAGSVSPGVHRHGHRHIHEAVAFDMTAAAILANDQHIGNYSSSDALYLDTETTGLAGGTGTMAFLIGLGWFEDGRFHIRQLLARDFGEEAAALLHLSAIAARKKFLVSFNGKAFDVNLLATRFILNRMPCDLAALPHLDLLHPSRRILGHRLENCRLATLEEQILGVRREGDIPGWEIPQRYFDWLKRRDPRLLADIFEHNRLDVISLATLTAHLVEILTAQAFKQYAETDDYLAAARLLLSRAGTRNVEKILDVLTEEGWAGISSKSKINLAQLYKRTGRREAAAAIWREMQSCEPVLFSAVSELAKHLEHRARDYAQAILLIESALARTNSFTAEERQLLRHRRERLAGKMAARG